MSAVLACRSFVVWGVFSDTPQILAGKPQLVAGGLRVSVFQVSGMGSGIGPKGWGFSVSFKVPFKARSGVSLGVPLVSGFRLGSLKVSLGAWGRW